MVVNELVGLLVFFNIIIIIGIGTVAEAVDGIAYKMYGKSGCSLLYEHRRNKIKERKEQRKQCKISTKPKEE